MEKDNFHNIATASNTRRLFFGRIIGDYIGDAAMLYSKMHHWYIASNKLQLVFSSTTGAVSIEDMAAIFETKSKNY